MFQRRAQKSASGDEKRGNQMYSFMRTHDAGSAKLAKPNSRVLHSHRPAQPQNDVKASYSNWQVVHLNADFQAFCCLRECRGTSSSLCTRVHIATMFTLPLLALWRRAWLYGDAYLRQRYMRRLRTMYGEIELNPWRPLVRDDACWKWCEDQYAHCTRAADAQ